jgi:hypothetical protein
MSPTRSNSENPVSSDPDAESAGYEDLKRVKGIGQAREQWLRDTFDVRTFQDLAALSADEIELRLKAEGQIVSRHTIEKWISEARRLESEAERPARPVAEAAKPTAREGWKPFASFVVEFQEQQTETGTLQQTVVHHMEADTGITWRGIEYGEIADWIAEQLGEKAAEPSASGAVTQSFPGPETVFSERLRAVLAKAENLSPHLQRAKLMAGQAHAPSPAKEEQNLAPDKPPTETPAVTGLQVHVTRLQAVQFATTKTPLSYIAGGEPFTLEAVLELNGLEALNLGDRPKGISAEVYATNLATGSVARLGSMTPVTLSKNVTSYEATLPNVSLAPGLYRLQIVAQLEGMPLIGYLDMPLLQVL